MIVRNANAATWWSNPPTDVSPVLAAYGRALYEVLSADLRQKLVSLLPSLAGTANDGLDETRGYLALDWLMRTYTPAWLELAGLRGSAASLRRLKPITDLRSARAEVLAARKAVYAAWAAARAAAGDAAGEIAELASWVAAGNAAGVATRDAAGAAVLAARVAAGNAAGVAARDAAGIAVWAARNVAVNARNSTGDVLSPTAVALQTSALDLFQSMIRP